MDILFNGIQESFDWSLVIKLTIAAFIGIVMGLERDLRRKPVGIKTCTVISVVSCLLTIVSIEAANIFSEAYSKPMDPLRLAAQIVSGVGFLGAGVILRRNNDIVSGLTTAAIVWGVSGIGIAIGADFLVEAIVASLFILVGVEFIPFLMKKITPFRIGDKMITIKITTKKGTNGTPILKAIKKQKIEISNVDIEDEKEEQTIIIIKGYTNPQNYNTDLYDFLSDIKEIEKIKIR